jgi:hypothetical protein
MLKVTIRLSEAEYCIMQAHTSYWLQWCFAHYKHSYTIRVDTEPIVAQMFGKYFSKKTSELSKFPKAGKAFEIEHYEIIAFLDLVSQSDKPTADLCKILKEDAANWKPSLSKPNFEKWYNSPDNNILANLFGPFEGLDDVSYEYMIGIYNHKNLPVPP